MNGLLAQQPAARSPVAHEGAEPETNVTPEEQQAYNEFVVNGQNLIFTDDDKVRPKVLKTLEGDGDPVMGLVNATVTIVQSLEDSAKAAGAEIDGDVLMHGGKELFEVLADAQSAAGIADLGEEELEAAFYQAVDTYREMKQGRGEIDQDAQAEELAMLIDAEEQGALDSVLPGASEAAQRFQSRGGA